MQTSFIHLELENRAETDRTDHKRNKTGHTGLKLGCVLVRPAL